MTQQEYEEAITHPKTYNSKQECIDGIFPIIEYYLKHTNVIFNNGRIVINSSQIILNKPDIKDERNTFALFMAYNKLIGEPITQTLIRKK